MNTLSDGQAGVEEGGPGADVNVAARPVVFGMTDRGPERATNDDQYLIGEIEQSMRVLRTSRPVDAGQKIVGSPQGHVYMVADGIGGAGGGNIASAVVIDTMARYVFMLMPWALARLNGGAQELADGLRNAVQQAQAAVRNVARREEIDRRMGTTLTAAFVKWPDLYIVHVGDSRCYTYRDGLRRITRDHTMAKKLLRQGVVASEKAIRPEFKNILVNAVGGENDELEVELHYTELVAGDVLLLCTDGLTARISDSEIEEAIKGAVDGVPVEQCVRALIETARRKGGTDNVTVVMARY
jgi:protein phosphatase